MKADTNGLIRRLAEKLEPVRPLPHPWLRTAMWLALSVPYVAIVVFLMGPRHDLASKLFEPRYLVEQASALAVGVIAAAAAFASTVPAYNRKFLMLPLLPLALWLGTLGHGCFQDWTHLGPDGLAVRSDWMCFPAIAFIGAVPAIAMSAMLRRGAPLTPHLTFAFGGLAASGLGSFGLRVTESQDASVMVLVWQVGSVFLLSAIAGSAGRRLLNWDSITGASENAGR
jgi:hypothetical protein